MEDENRALAKRTYVEYRYRVKNTGNEHTFRLKDNKQFFGDFYKAFFKKAKNAKKKFDPKVDPADKLMDAMEAVLNFRAGNEPTSLSRYIQKHSDLNVTEQEVEVFSDVFLDTLERKLPRHIPKEQRIQICCAWKDLLKPIVEYFKKQLTQLR